LAGRKIGKTGKSGKTASLLLLTLVALSAGPVPTASLQGAESLAPTNLGLALQAEVGRAQHASSELGVHIVELDTGETVYDFNADRPRVIASNTKLFTTAAILDALGPGLRRRFLRGVPPVGADAPRARHQPGER